MCTGAEILVGSVVAGSIIKGVGSVMGGNAKANAQRNQAAIDEQDAKLAGYAADDAIRRSLVEEGKIREHGARVIGKQKLAISSGNIDPTSGSAALVQEGAAGATEEEAQQARLDGMREAYGYRTQGLRFQMIASARRSAAGDYEAAGWLGAAGSAVEIAGETRNWWQMKPEGSEDWLKNDYLGGAEYT